MQHTFSQKFILVVLAGALVAAAYVYVYKNIDKADQAVNGGYATPTPRPIPARRY